MPAFHQPILASVMALQWRALLITYRNQAFVMGKLAMVIIMGLLYCSVFYQFDPTQIAVVMGVMFAAVMFLSMGQGAMIPVYISGRAIFYKQRRANFFRTGSYVLATTVSQIPLALAETIVFGSIVYWVCGFASDVKLFIIFEVVLFVSNLAMGMWFFFLAGVCPDANVVMPVGMVSILVFIIFAGFVVTKSQIPDYLIWAYWISPIGWALKALAINQYRSSEFDVCVYDAVDYCAKYNGLMMGEYYLDLFDFATEKEWVVYAIIYLLAVYVFFTSRAPPALRAPATARKLRLRLSTMHCLVLGFHPRASHTDFKPQAYSLRSSQVVPVCTNPKPAAARKLRLRLSTMHCLVLGFHPRASHTGFKPQAYSLRSSQVVPVSMNPKPAAARKLRLRLRTRCARLTWFPSP
uniref:ABC-2 type transporter transmembrane domain-containing protein n=1 Tax=Phytophthora ramorum TaxID=164328 RepID=H3H9N2_PHYRM